jgi:DNA-binding response OmpR family regulator
MEAASLSPDTLRAGPIEIEPAGFTAFARGRALTLSVHEYHLLAVLAERAGRVVSREDLYRLVWGGQRRRGDRSVDVYVRKLRAKLEEALPDETFIHTHFGFGYRFHREPSQLFHKSATRR